MATTPNRDPPSEGELTAKSEPSWIERLTEILKRRVTSLVLDEESPERQIFDFLVDLVSKLLSAE